MAWWTTFALVAKLIVSLGFGPGSVAADMKWIVISPLSPLHVAGISSRPGSLATALQPFVHDDFTSAGGQLRNLSGYGHAGDTDVARCYHCHTSGYANHTGRDTKHKARRRFREDD
jgi:hypothetical protein